MELQADTETESRLDRRASWLASVAAHAAILGGGLGLWGWALDLTALCFLLAGVALLLHGHRPAPVGRRRRLALGVASVIALVGLLTLAEYLLQRDLGINRWLFQRALVAAGGGMSPATATGFLLTGLALGLLDVPSRRLRRAAWPLAPGVALLGLLGLELYLFHATTPRGVWFYSSMAVHTATLFVVVGLGLLLIRPSAGAFAILTRPGAGGALARSLLPATIGIPVMLAWALLRLERARVIGDEVVLGAFAMSTIVLFTAVVWRTARRLDRLEAQRRAELTARLEAETAAREAQDSARLLGLALEHASDAVIGLDLDARVTSWSAGATRIYGFTASEAIGRLGPDLLLPPDAFAERAAVLERVRDTRERFFETRRLNQAGETLDVEISVAPIRDAGGVPIGQLSISRDVTARRRAERTLRDSEERFRAVVEVSPHGLAILSADGSIVTVNREVERAFGYARDELIGAPAETLLPIDPGGRRQHGRRKDGRVFPIELGLTPISTGLDARLLATIVDISERAKLEAELREQASILDLAPVMVCDMDESIVLWNQGAETLYGFTRTEALGRDARTLLRSEFPEPREAIQACLHRTGAWDGEVTRYRRDGRAVVVATRWALYRDAHGRPFRILEASADITERKRAQEDAHVSRARLAAALEGGDMGTWVWDIPRGILSGDEALRRLFDPRGDQPGAIELEMDTVFARIHPEDQERVRAALDTAVREGRKYDVEYRATRVDDVEVWIASRGRVEYGADGRPRRVTGVSADITARKRTEAGLLQAQKMEALGTLAGGIAHDFNNVLSIIMGNLSMMTEAVPATDRLQTYLGRMDRATLRARDMVRRILTFSRRQESEREVTSLAPIVEEAVQFLRATLPAMLEIRAELAPGLPDVAVDATQVHQVIMNLGTNAAHAMGGQGCLELRAEALTVDVERARRTPGLQAGPCVLVSVRDTGHGMDRATLARIFDPFFTTKRPGEGTGLGLSVAHGIMQSHGGAITAYSEPGRGTVFYLYFPVGERSAVAPAELDAAVPGHDKRVLFVDDEEDIAELGIELLQRLGYQVTGVVDPSAALQLFKARPFEFDAVISDLAMPGMSGLALAGALREIRPDVPIILCSGLVSEDALASAAVLGVQEVIPKPYSVPALARALHQAFTG